MHSRILTAVVVAAVSLTGCASDGDDATSPAVDVTETGGSDGTTVTTTSAAAADLELSDTAPAGADLVIEASGTTTDRPVQRGGQPAVEQGQTFAVAETTVVNTVSFHVVAPDGVDRGEPIEMALYEVGDVSAMAPSAPVALSDAGPLVLPIPEAIEANRSTYLVFSVPGVELLPGQYAVVLSFGDGAGPSQMFLQHAADDVYADGVAISLEGEFWKADTNDHDSAVTLSFDA